MPHDQTIVGGCEQIRKALPLNLFLPLHRASLQVQGNQSIGADRTAAMRDFRAGFEERIRAIREDGRAARAGERGLGWQHRQSVSIQRHRPDPFRLRSRRPGQRRWRRDGSLRRVWSLLRGGGFSGRRSLVARCPRHLRCLGGNRSGLKTGRSLLSACRLSRRSRILRWSQLRSGQNAAECAKNQPSGPGPVLPTQIH
jgi:hypothetical protein